MTTYEKVYTYNGTTITIDVLLNTGIRTNDTGVDEPTSSIQIAFNSEVNRTDDIPNRDLQQREADLQAAAEAYIDGLNDSALEEWLIDAGFTKLTTLSTPGNVDVAANGTNAVDVKSDPVTSATSYLYEISANAGFKGLAGSHTQATSAVYTFTGLDPASIYYARVRAMADGYSDSDYGYGQGSTD